jgi:transposase
VLAPLWEADKAAVIAPKRSRTVQREYDAALHEARHLIEQSCTLTHLRAIATRYDKTAGTVLAAVSLAGTAILLN